MTAKSDGGTSATRATWNNGAQSLYSRRAKKCVGNVRAFSMVTIVQYPELVAVCQIEQKHDAAHRAVNETRQPAYRTQHRRPSPHSQPPKATQMAPR